MVWIAMISLSSMTLMAVAFWWLTNQQSRQAINLSEMYGKQSEANIRLMSQTVQETVSAVSRELYGERSEVAQAVIPDDVANFYKSMWEDPLPDANFDPATYLEPEMEPEGRVAFGPSTNGTNPLIPGPSVPSDLDG